MLDRISCTKFRKNIMVRLIFVTLIFLGLVLWGCGKSEPEQKSNETKQHEGLNSVLLSELIAKLSLYVDDPYIIAVSRIDKNTPSIHQLFQTILECDISDIVHAYEGFTLYAVTTRPSSSAVEGYGFNLFYLKANFDELVKKLTNAREVLMIGPSPGQSKSSTTTEKGENIFEVESLNNGILFTTKNSLKGYKKWGDRCPLKGFLLQKMKDGCILYYGSGSDSVYKHIEKISKEDASTSNCLREKTIAEAVKNTTMDNIIYMQIQYPQKSEEENSAIVGKMIIKQSVGDNLIEIDSWTIYKNPQTDETAKIVEENILDALEEEIILLKSVLIDKSLKIQIKIKSTEGGKDVFGIIQQMPEYTIKVTNQGFVWSKDWEQEKVARLFLSALQNKDKLNLVSLSRGKALEWVNQEFGNKMTQNEISGFILRDGGPDMSSTPPLFKFCGTIVKHENNQTIRERFKIIVGREGHQLVVLDLIFLPSK